jgi:hypothetical protein
MEDSVLTPEPRCLSPRRWHTSIWCISTQRPKGLMANKLLEKTAKLSCLYTLSFVGLCLTFGGVLPVDRKATHAERTTNALPMKASAKPDRMV